VRHKEGAVAKLKKRGLGGLGASPPQKPSFPSMEELLRKTAKRSPFPLPPSTLPPVMPQWIPTPTAPFSGLTAYDWKTPSREPFPIGTVRERPRLPPTLSPLELEQWKLNDRKQLEEMFSRMQYGPSHRNF
jgi:hypothetical protein